MKLMVLILVGSFSFLSCTSSLRHAGTLSHSADKHVISSNDSSWFVPPIQTEDLQFLDQDPPELQGSGLDFDVKPYVVRQNENASQSSGVKTGELKKVKGYRVQLFAGHEQDRALDIKAAAESRYGISVYLVYEAPQYKVRAGNFVNRMKATELMNSIKMDGFRDAWIVKSQIEIEQ